MTKLLLVLLASGAFAQTAVAPPQLGFMQDAGNSLRPVYGIAGNFVLGDSAATRVESSAFSGTYGLVKTARAVVVTDNAGHILGGRGTVGQGPALFAFSANGDPAFVYLSGENALMAWKGKAFRRLSMIPDQVLSVAAVTSGYADLVVKRADGLWDIRIDSATGDTVSQTSLPGIDGPVLMLSGGLLIYGDAKGVVIRKPDGSEKHMDAQLPGNFTLQQMGDGWVQLRDLDGQRQFAIRIAENREQLFVLPGAAQ